MIIHASVRGKGWKRGAEKKAAEALGVTCGLHDMVGSLELTAERAGEILFLRDAYNHVFSRLDSSKGTIAVFDGEGKEICRYGNIPERSEFPTKPAADEVAPGVGVSEETDTV